MGIVSHDNHFCVTLACMGQKHVKLPSYVGRRSTWVWDVKRAYNHSHGMSSLFLICPIKLIFSAAGHDYHCLLRKRWQ